MREVEKPEQWRKYAARVQENALKLVELAKKQNRDGLQSAYEQTVQSCNDCHREFEPMHAPELDP